jgi:hypothetical protein
MHPLASHIAIHIIIIFTEYRKNSRAIDEQNTGCHAVSAFIPDSGNLPCEPQKRDV